MFVLLQQGLDEIGVPFGVCQVKQRMHSPVSIPEGVYMIVIESFTLMNLVIHSPVLSVNIGVEVWREKSMIESGVEYFLLVCRAAFGFNFSQFVIPGFFGILHGFVEIPARELFLHVFPGALGTYGRQGNFNKDRLAVFLME